MRTTGGRAAARDRGVAGEGRGFGAVRAWPGRTVAAPRASDGSRSSTRRGGSWRSGACSRPCARNGGRSRPPGPGDARRTPSGPRAPCRAAGRHGRSRTAAAEAAGAGPVEPLAHPRVRRRLPHAEERAQVARPDRVLAAPHLPAGLQKRRDPGREDREPRRQASRKAEVARDGRVGDAVEACTHGAKRGPWASTDACVRGFRTFAARLLPGRGKADPAGKACEREFVAAVQPADSERKEILWGIAALAAGASCRTPRTSGFSPPPFHSEVQHLMQRPGRLDDT